MPNASIVKGQLHYQLLERAQRHGTALRVGGDKTLGVVEDALNVLKGVGLKGRDLFPKGLL